MLAGKTLLDDPNLFSPSDYSRECQNNIYIKTLNTDMTKEDINLNLLKK